MKVRDRALVPADTLLDNELAAEDTVEMANLTFAQMGVPRTIFISTAMGGYGPRVKYFVSVSDTPRVLANSLPQRLLSQTAPQVISSVSLNKDALLESWNHGDTWTQPEVNEFVQKLRRL
jgi:hypothetical protein